MAMWPLFPLIRFIDPVDRMFAFAMTQTPVVMGQAPRPTRRPCFPSELHRDPEQPVEILGLSRKGGSFLLLRPTQIPAPVVICLKEPRGRRRRKRGLTRTGHSGSM